MEFILEHFTAADLRDACGRLNLPTSGVKEILIKRIIEHSNQIEGVKSNDPIRVKIFGGKMESFWKLPNIFKAKMDDASATNGNCSLESSLSLTRLIRNCTAVIVPVFGVIGGTFALISMYQTYFEEKVVVSGYRLW